MSNAALELITALGDEVPERWRQLAAEVHPEQVDPRLPAIDTTLKRVYRGAPHEVTIAADGVTYKGERFRTFLQAQADQDGIKE